MGRTIEINQTVTVSQLAQQLELPPTALVAELFKSGVVVTVNESLDLAAVQQLVGSLGLDVEVVAKDLLTADTLPPALRTEGDMQARPPIVALMGHVDHGKTTLITKLCQTDTNIREAGDITQHITAYQRCYRQQMITFLDTPGHEAFSALREHGAVLTDIILVVIAADEGIKPQTEEVFRFANKEASKVIVVINKIDRAPEQLEVIKQQLTENNLATDSSGQSAMVVAVSALKGEGIEELLDLILLLTETESWQADTSGTATGWVIESFMKPGLGPVAILLVQQGQLRPGDFLVAGGGFGRVRTCHDLQQQPVEMAGPSTPVLVSGFKTLPEFGAHFEVVDDKKGGRLLADHQSSQSKVKTKASGMSQAEMLRIINQRTQVKQHSLIIKTDVKGSLVAVRDSILSLNNDEVSSQIVLEGVGPVTERDIWLAKSVEADIYCFHVKTPSRLISLAKSNGVQLKTYDIIYDLLEDIRQVLEGLLDPEIVTVELGHLVVKGIFKSTRTVTICGGQISRQELSLPALASAWRGQSQIADNLKVASLRKETKEVNKVEKGALCGLSLATKTKLDLQVGDQLRFYRQETKARRLT